MFNIKSFFLLAFSLFLINQLNAQALSDSVMIKRTAFGVPHIQAKSLKAGGYAMGYVQMEDYDSTIVAKLIKARGEWTKYNEINENEQEMEIDKDALNQLYYRRAVETFPRLNIQTRNLIEGYAAGVNKYIKLHRGNFPKWIKPNFNAIDIHAAGVKSYNKAPVRNLITTLRKKDSGKATAENLTPWGNIAINTPKENPDVGSNAWALAPSRSKSGNAMLLRNPHLNWDAGYYEVQFEVKGLFNFYGDFRIGQPLGVVGGFNKNLGWSTTNNSPRIEEIYAFDIDPKSPDNYLLDGKSHPLIKSEITVEYKSNSKTQTAKRDLYTTAYGPVIYRDDDKIYIIKSTKDGEYRGDQQYLKMMQAKNLEEWKEAMRMQGLYNSNFTYADGEGNIFYVWNAAIPKLPKLWDNKDKIYISATKTSDIWMDIFPWDSLPQLHNPKGGYIHNENDSFHFTNLNDTFNAEDYPDNFEEPKLDLRSQLSLKLIDGKEKLSLEEMIKRKKDLSMLLADRVKDNLIKAVQSSHLNKVEKKGLRQLKKWDNTVAKDSKGGILFQLWWNQYVKLTAQEYGSESSPESAGFSAPGNTLFAKPWNKDNPTQTPRGLANNQRAVKAFKTAIQQNIDRYGTIDLKWGDIHRAKLGPQDYPIGGASGEYGCFTVFWYQKDKSNNKLNVVGGDGWVLAVEFDKTPRAYSILAYGESNKKDSPYFADQLKMFSNGQLKTVFYTTEDIDNHTIEKYHPGKGAHKN